MSPLHSSTRILLCSLVFVAAGCHYRTAPVAESSVTSWGKGADAAAPVAAPGSASALPSASGAGAATAAGRVVDGTRTARIEDLFAGRFPGLDVRRTADGGLSMQLRGRQPLLVIDGMEADPVALVSIPPRTVLRIEVLRNGNETALYGSRGLNGEVLVTTRR